MARDDDKNPLPAPPPPLRPAQYDHVTHGADTETFETKVVRETKQR